MPPTRKKTSGERCNRKNSYDGFVFSIAKVSNLQLPSDCHDDSLHARLMPRVLGSGLGRVWRRVYRTTYWKLAPDDSVLMLVLHGVKALSRKTGSSPATNPQECVIRAHKAGGTGGLKFRILDGHSPPCHRVCRSLAVRLTNWKRFRCERSGR